MTDMHYYFIGIKGTGMAALACILNDLGYEVSGSDLPKHFFTEDALVERKIPIYEFNPANITDGMNVIIGNAFLEDFPEVAAARNNPSCRCMRYHEFVGDFTKRYHLISVSGSHGKTTTTGMLSCMLSQLGETGWLIGDGTGHISPAAEYMCLESCEFRRHFLAYHPEYAIMTNIDLDHVDYFHDEADYRSAYEQFSRNVTKGIVIYGDDEQARMLDLNPEIEHYWYGVKEDDDIQAVDIEERSDGMSFRVLFHGKEIGRFELPFVGRHMLLNSLACIGIGILEGMDPRQMEAGLSSFHGAKRRFAVETVGDCIFVDDYAHHPTEISVVIDTAKTRFPGQKMVAIVKPHRASRLLYFADQFASALKKADRVYLIDFTSIDDKQDGVDISVDYLQKMVPGSEMLTEDEAGAKRLAKEAPCCYLFMSSKDIYPLEEKVKRVLMQEKE